MKLSNIIPKKLNEHDRKLFKEIFSFLSADDKRAIADDFNVSYGYINFICALEKYNQKIFTSLLEKALKNKKAHIQEIQKIKS